jgi:hypothetical protein
MLHVMTQTLGIIVAIAAIFIAPRVSNSQLLRSTIHRPACAMSRTAKRPNRGDGRRQNPGVEEDGRKSRRVPSKSNNLSRYTPLALRSCRGHCY